jgi:hypothetical protein
MHSDPCSNCYLAGLDNRPSSPGYADASASREEERRNRKTEGRGTEKMIWTTYKKWFHHPHELEQLRYNVTSYCR